MRGFMRAIGLGGLFRHHSRRHAGSRAQHQGHQSQRGMGSLVPVHEIPTFLPEQSMRTSMRFRDSIMSMARGRRSSSIYDERPQFLFFCGSDSGASGLPASRHRAPAHKTSFTFVPSPTRANQIPAPQISHKMPVFFAPQQAMNSE